LDVTITRDKKRLLCLHVGAYAPATYQLGVRDVGNGKMGATKADSDVWRREREREREERHVSKGKMIDK
jgi:hypothetical protein